ncbi:MAG: type IV pilus twitching motility protein PilT [Christensenellales bacterium]
MSEIMDLIHYARQNDCSDIHLTENYYPVFRKYGQIFACTDSSLACDAKSVIWQMLNDEQREKISHKEDIDFSMVTPDGLRQRVNVYYQQGTLSAAIRIINSRIPGFEELGLPSVLRSLVHEPRGLVLVTGPAGSGKSTTLAAMIDYINTCRKCHIITIEDPIEYKHSHKSSIIHQREVGLDIPSFGTALRSVLREDPDVILVGEMRDLETISAAMTAAETGHLVLSTLHTVGAANTIDRIIDVFPLHSHAQVRSQLSGVLKGIITQQLIPRADGKGRCAAFEVLAATDAVLNLIRENKCHQINSLLQTGGKEEMCTLNASLARLVQTGKVTLESALEKASDRKELVGLVNGCYT